MRDEGAEYAARLKEAGVPVTYRHFPGQFHGFFTMGKLLQQANVAVSEIGAWLKAQRLVYEGLCGMYELPAYLLFSGSGIRPNFLRLRLLSENSITKVARGRETRVRRIVSVTRSKWSADLARTYRTGLPR